MPVVDTTAAGDAFGGNLGAGLANGLTWDESVIRGIHAGALAVTVAGASTSLPTAQAVDAFIRTQNQDTQNENAHNKDAQNKDAQNQD